MSIIFITFEGRNHISSHMNISRLSKYGGIIAIILILITPPILNWVLSRPAFCRIVGTDVDWLSFYGGYIGSVISSMVAFFILHQQLKNNHEENKRNRDIQRNIIRYQQEKERLDRLKLACTENVICYDVTPLYHIATTMISNPEQASTDLDLLSNKMKTSNLQIAILGDYITDEAYVTYHTKREAASNEYYVLIMDINFILRYSESRLFYDELDLCLSKGLVSESTYNLINQKNTENPQANKQSFKLLVFNLLQNYSLNREVKAFTLDFLYLEENRLNKILLQNENQ